MNWMCLDKEGKDSRTKSRNWEVSNRRKLPWRTRLPCWLPKSRECRASWSPERTDWRSNATLSPIWSSKSRTYKILRMKSMLYMLNWPVSKRNWKTGWGSTMSFKTFRCSTIKPMRKSTIWRIRLPCWVQKSNDCRPCSTQRDWNSMSGSKDMLIKMS